MLNRTRERQRVKMMKNTNRWTPQTWAMTALFALSGLALPGVAAAQTATTTWHGQISTNFADANNWTSGLPGSAVTAGGSTTGPRRGIILATSTTVPTSVCFIAPNTGAARDGTCNGGTDGATARTVNNAPQSSPGNGNPPTYACYNGGAPNQPTRGGVTFTDNGNTTINTASSWQPSGQCQFRYTDGFGTIATSATNLPTISSSFAMANAAGMTISGGSLTVSAAFTNIGGDGFSQSAGTLTQGANITLASGTATFSGGTQNLNSSTFTAASGLTASGGTMTVANGATLTNTTGTTTVSNGSLTVNAGGILNVGTALAISGGTLTSGGSITQSSGGVTHSGGTFNSNVSFNVPSGYTLSGSGALAVGGGTLTITAGDFTKSSSGSATIASGSGLTVTNGTFSQTAGTTTVTGTLTANGTGAITNSGTLNLASGAAMNLTGAFTPGTFSANAASTTTFNGASQTVPATTYGNLTLNPSSGTTTLTAATTVAGTLSLGSSRAAQGPASGSGNINANAVSLASGSTYTGNAISALVVTGGLTVDGTLNLSTGTNSAGSYGGSGTLTMTGGTLNVPSITSSTVNMNTGSPTINLSGSSITVFSPAGGTRSTGTVNVTGASPTLGGVSYPTLTFNHTGTATLNGGASMATLTTAGTVQGNGSGTITATTFNQNGTFSTAGTALSISGTTTNAGTLNLNGGTHSLATFTNNGSSTATLSAGGATVTTLNQNGTLNVSGGTHTATTYTAGGSSTLAITGGSLQVPSVSTGATNMNTGGTLILTGTGTPFAPASGTRSSPSAIRFDGNGATISGIAHPDVTINGTSQTISTGASFGALTVNSSRSATISSGTATAASLANSGTMTVGGTLDLTGSSPLSGTLPTGAGTIGFTGTTQTVAGGAYGSLSLHLSGGTKTLGGTITTASSMMISSGATFAMGSNSATLSGALVNMGTFSVPSGQTLSVGSLSTPAAATATISGTFTSSGSTAFSGTTTANSGSEIQAGGALSFAGTTSLNSASTVRFTSSSATQTVPTGITWGNIRMSNTGSSARTIFGNATHTIAGNLTLDATAWGELSSGANVNLAGNWVDNSSTLVAANWTYTLGAATVTLTGSGTATLSNQAGIPGNLVVTGTNKSLAGDAAVAGTFNPQSGASFSIGGNNLYLVGDTNLGSTTALTASSGKLWMSCGNSTGGTGTSTFTLPSGTTTIGEIETFGDCAVTMANTNPLTLSNFTLQSGGTFTSLGGTFNVSGNWDGSGTFTTNDSTLVNLNGTGAQTVLGSFGDLTVNKSSGTATAAGAFDVNDTLTVSAGTLNLGTGFVHETQNLTASGTSTLTIPGTTTLNVLGLASANGSGNTVSMSNASRLRLGSGNHHQFKHVTMSGTVSNRPTLSRINGNAGSGFYRATFNGDTSVTRADFNFLADGGAGTGGLTLSGSPVAAAPDGDFNYNAFARGQSGLTYLRITGSSYGGRTFTGLTFWKPTIAMPFTPTSADNGETFQANAGGDDYAIDNDSGSSITFDSFSSGDNYLFGDGVNDPGSGSDVDWGTTKADVAYIGARGSLKDAKVEINWVTASETNNIGFTVMRSASPVGPFEVVSGMIPGLGTSPVGKSYSHVDLLTVGGGEALVAARTTGELYYKVEDLDFNGQTKSWGPVRAVWTDGFDAGTQVSDNTPRVSGQAALAAVTKLSGFGSVSNLSARNVPALSATKTVSSASSAGVCGAMGSQGGQWAEVSANDSGLARVTLAELADAGVDLTGITTDRIEVLSKSLKTVGFSVEDGGDGKLDDATDAVLFDVERAAGRDGLVGYVTVKAATAAATVTTAKVSTAAGVASKLTTAPADGLVTVELKSVDSASMGCK
jgi:fibronectin-binding autotransporter adhesin